MNEVPFEIEEKSAALDPPKDWWFPAVLVILTLVCVLALIFLESPHALAGSLPGSDESGKLDAAGTLLRLIDTGLFQWGARIFAGICIMSAGWALKEQRFGTAVICVIGAITFGTAPKWVKNIFEVGGNQGLFSKIDQHHLPSFANLQFASGEKKSA